MCMSCIMICIIYQSNCIPIYIISIVPDWCSALILTLISEFLQETKRCIWQWWLQSLISFYKNFFVDNQWFWITFINHITWKMAHKIIKKFCSTSKTKTWISQLSDTMTFDIMQCGACTKWSVFTKIFTIYIPRMTYGYIVWFYSLVY